jgi:hypothetical protein
LPVLIGNVIFKNDKKVYPTKKVLFVDSYGVKILPYWGRRKHFSSIRQILGFENEGYRAFFKFNITVEIVFMVK